MESVSNIVLDLVKLPNMLSCILFIFIFIIKLLDDCLRRCYK